MKFSFQQTLFAPPVRPNFFLVFPESPLKTKNREAGTCLRAHHPELASSIRHFRRSRNSPQVGRSASDNEPIFDAAAVA
jgi:hypothetical protein